MVQSFLHNGDFVIASGRNLKSRQDLFSHERLAYQERFLEMNLDVTQPGQIQQVQQEILTQVGTIDILINNAGHGLFGALEDLSGEEIRDQMEVNFFGTVEVTRAFIPSLRKSRGMIFNFSSVFGFMGFPLTSLYCASKYAIEGLSESLRYELSAHGVQVCLIEPGGYQTGFGQNLKWSQGQAQSVHQLPLKNYQDLHELVSKKKAQDPSEVALGVLKLSKKKKLPLRKVFGRDGKMSYVLKLVLPEFIFVPIMEVFYKKMFFKP
jgi:short-subunit dehydrogenase